MIRVVRRDLVDPDGRVHRRVKVPVYGPPAVAEIHIPELRQTPQIRYGRPAA